MKSGVYQILCTPTGKRYIGSSVNVTDRLRHHRNALRRGTHDNSHMQQAFIKHGQSAFDFRVLEMCDIGDIRQREKEIIDRLRPAFNARGIDPEKGLLYYSEETRAKISAAAMGNRNGLGCTHSAESIAKTSAAHRGLKYSAEARAKLSTSAKRTKNFMGHKHSDETKAKLSAASTGNKHHLGHKHTTEARAKMSAAALRRRVKK